MRCRVAAALVLTVAAAVTPASAVGLVSGIDGTHPTVIVLAADPSTSIEGVEVDGDVVAISYGAPVPVHLDEDNVTLDVDGVAPFDLDTGGCDALVTLDRHGWTVHRDCGTQRLSIGTASVRFAHAGIALGDVEVGIQGDRELVAPRSAGDRVEVQAGEAHVTVSSADRPLPFVSATAELTAGGQNFAVLLGGGDHPVELVLFEYARQPDVPVAVDARYETDVVDDFADRLWVVQLILAALALVALARRRPTLSAIVAVILLAAACGDTSVGRLPVAGTVPTSPSTRSVPPPSSSSIPTPMAEHLGTAPPVSVRFGDTVANDIVAVAAGAASQLHRVLEDPAVAWFDGTARVGELGTMVLAGHVAAAGDRPGVFSELPSAEPDDVVSIEDANGVVVDYVVERIASFPKGAIPDLGLAAGAPTVALITCGGPIDPRTGRRSDNIVVFAAADPPPLTVQRYP